MKPTTLLTLLLIGCSGAQPLIHDASCSPKADAARTAELESACFNKLIEECPEAKEIGDRYEQRALKECEENDAR